jgi:hypothetical protein
MLPSGGALGPTQRERKQSVRVATETTEGRNRGGGTRLTDGDRMVGEGVANLRTRPLRGVCLRGGRDKVVRSEQPTCSVSADATVVTNACTGTGRRRWLWVG